MSKQFWAVIVVIVLIFVGIFAFGGKKSSSTTAGSKDSSSTLTEHVEGKNADHVTLVEYGDYQCPYCQVYSSTVKTIAGEFNDQIQFQYRNFPLTSVHANAFAAARAAEAANLQGKFWEMHDLLYENNDPNEQSGWVVASDPTTYFDQFAKSIGLNMTQYHTDFASSKVNYLINADEAEGNKLGIQGTPTFFLDGKQVTIANTTAAFEKVINAEIAKKAPTAAAPSGTSTAAPSATDTASSGTSTAASTSGQ